MEYEKSKAYGESDGLNSKEDYMRFINSFKFSENGDFFYKFKNDPRVYKHEKKEMFEKFSKEWLNYGPIVEIGFYPFNKQ